MSAPDDLLEAAAAAVMGIKGALAELVDDEPEWAFVRRTRTAAERARAEDARVARLIAIGEAVVAATVGPGGVEVCVAGAYVWSAAELLGRLLAAGEGNP